MMTQLLCASQNLALAERLLKHGRSPYSKWLSITSLCSGPIVERSYLGKLETTTHGWARERADVRLMPNAHPALTRLVMVQGR
jgi:hypothetical protein